MIVKTAFGRAGQCGGRVGLSGAKSKRGARRGSCRTILVRHPTGGFAVHPFVGNERERAEHGPKGESQGRDE